MRGEGEGRVRLHPRVSVAKMAEYLEATANRRERILQDQKFPPDFQTTTYRDAYEVTRRALIRGGDVVASLRAAAGKLQSKPCASSHDARSLACSIAAIELFATLYPKLGLSGVEATFVGHRRVAQWVEGVTISAYPLVLLKRLVRGSDQVGALLLVFRKDEALTKHGGDATAELLRGAVVEGGLIAPSSIKPELCLVVDVFHSGVHHAPRNRKRLISEIESACREISVLWPAVGRRVA